MIGFQKTEKRVGLGTNRVRKTRSPSWPSPLEWSERLKAVKKKNGVTSPVCSALTKTTSLSFHFGGTLSFNPSLPTTTPPRERKVREKRKKQWAVGERCQYRWKVWGTKTWCSWRNSTQPSSLSATTTSTTPMPSSPVTSPSSVSSVYLFPLPHIIIFYGLCFFLLLSLMGFCYIGLLGSW